MKLNTLSDLFVHELLDAQSAEQQLIQALPKLAKAAKNPNLRAAIEAHLQETREQLDKVTGLITETGGKPAKTKCVGMAGIIKEAEDLLEEDAPDAVKDAAIIGAAQRAEHYEMAVYGTAKAYAEILGDESATKVLERIFDQERAADEKLSDIAELVNSAAHEEKEGTRTRR